MHNTSIFQNALSATKIIYELVSEDFQSSQLLERFPRDIESLIINVLEIPVIRLPDLSPQNTTQYLCTLDKKAVFQVQGEEPDNRSLYGMLHVGPPSNIIFVQEGLSTSIVNYVLAHEIGHFIADVLWIRQLWLATLPEKRTAIQNAFAWESLDGELELTAVIKGLPDRPKTINGRGHALAQDTTHREIRADLIARELLAPWEIASKLLRPNRQELSSLLQQQFGLPKKIAIQYSEDLTQCLTNHPDTIDRLFGTLVRGSDPDVSEK